MYTLSQRLKGEPSDDENEGYRYNSTPRAVVLETFENLEDACLALAKKQNSRKNTDEFFIEFLRATQGLNPMSQFKRVSDRDSSFDATKTSINR